jgi:hypothetical protein
MGVTTLGISAGKFTINGTPTFLLGLSYFHAVKASSSDLTTFKSRGYNYVRLFLDWVDDATESVTRSGAFSVFNADGTLKSTKNDILTFIRDADAVGIVVELVVLNAATSGWITTGANRTSAVQNAISYFGGESNVLFDLINEAEQCSYITAFSDITAIVTTANTQNSTPIYTVSVSPGTLAGDGPLIDNTTDVIDVSYATSYMGTGVDALSYHYKGNVQWWSDKGVRVANTRAWLDANGYSATPLHINEDNRWGTGYGDAGAGDIEADKYLATAVLAKINNAASWIHHSNASYDMTTSAVFRTRFANADEQDVYDRIGPYVLVNGLSLITHDATSESAVGSAVSTRSWSHTTGTLTNGALKVGTSSRGNSAANLVVSNVTYNGVALTKQREDISAAFSGPEFCGTSLWTLVNPPVGTFTVVVTYTGSISNIVTAHASTYNNVHQSTPVAEVGGASDVSGTSSLASITITTTKRGCLVVDSAYTGDDPLWSVGGAQIARSRRAVTGVSTDNVGGSEQAAPEPAAIPMTWEPINPSLWCTSAMALRPIDQYLVGTFGRRSHRPRPFSPGLAR